MFGMFLFGDSTSGGNGGGLNSIWFLIIIVALFVALMVWSSWSNKKRQKKAQEINDKMKPGDKVMSIGGIMGVIVEIREDSFVIKSGDCLIELTRQAVNSMENFAPTQTAPAPEAQPAEGEAAPADVPAASENTETAAPEESEAAAPEADAGSAEQPEAQAEPQPEDGEVGH